MLYYVKEVKDDKVVISTVAKGITKEVSMKDLDNMTEVIVGYNKVTKKVTVKEPVDVVSYVISRGKLSGKETRIAFTSDHSKVIYELSNKVEIETTDTAITINVRITDEDIEDGVANIGCILWDDVFYGDLQKELDKFTVKDLYWSKKDITANIVFDLKGNTDILTSNERPMHYDEFDWQKFKWNVVFTSKDLSGYSQIIQPFQMRVQFTEDLLSDLLSEDALYMPDGNMFNTVTLENPVLDLRDFKFKPDVKLRSLSANFGRVLTPQGIKHTYMHENALDFAEYNYTGYNSIEAKTYYTENKSISEIYSKKYDKVQNLVVGGVCFDMPVQKMQRKGNLYILNPSNDKEHEYIEFKPEFLDSIHKLIHGTAIVDFLDDEQEVLEIHTYKDNVNNDCYAFKPIWNFNLSNVQGYLTKNQRIVCEQLRKIIIPDFSMFYFPTKYNEEHLAEIIAFLMFAFTYIRERYKTEICIDSNVILDRLDSEDKYGMYNPNDIDDEIDEYTMGGLFEDDDQW